MIFESKSARATESFAADFARTLRAGRVIALHGEMGAGKTHFVRGMVKGLGGDPRIVSSPTYVLLNIYDSTRITIFHLDAYRVRGADDFDAIGFPELLEQNGLVVVEWPERVVGLLPLERIDITLTATGPSTRRIVVNERVRPLHKTDQERPL